MEKVIEEEMFKSQMEKASELFLSEKKEAFLNKTEDIIQVQKNNLNSSDEEPLTIKQLSTLKAFEQLRISLIQKLNKKIQFSRPLDYYRSLRNISFLHKLLFHLGCLRYDPDSDTRENMNEIF